MDVVPMGAPLAQEGGACAKRGSSAFQSERVVGAKGRESPKMEGVDLKRKNFDSVLFHSECLGTKQIEGEGPLGPLITH